MGRLLAVALLSTLASAAAADPPKGSPGRPPEGRAEKERLRQQIFDQLRAFRMWKITEELKLDEATAARLFPLLAKYDEQERGLGRERGHTYRDLRRELDAPAPDAGRVEAMVEKLVTLRTRREALEQEKVAAIRRVLTPVQMAKLLMILPRVEEGFRQRIREAIEHARGEAGRGESGRGEGSRVDGRRRFRFEPDAP